MNLGAVKLRALAPYALGLAAVLALALGRACSPPAHEVRTEERAAAVETEAAAAVLETEHAAPVRRRETSTTERPDGSRTVTVTEEERGPTVRTVETASAARVRASSVERLHVERERPAPRWRLTGAASWDVTAPTLRPDVYRVELARRVAGPVWLGAWAGTDRAAGLSVSVVW